MITIIGRILAGGGNVSQRTLHRRDISASSAAYSLERDARRIDFASRRRRPRYQRRRQTTTEPRANRTQELHLRRHIDRASIHFSTAPVIVLDLSAANRDRLVRCFDDCFLSNDSTPSTSIWNDSSKRPSKSPTIGGPLSELFRPVRLITYLYNY